MGKQIRLDIIDIDQYRRMVGIIWIGNRNINLEMVRQSQLNPFFVLLFVPLLPGKFQKNLRSGLFIL
jgi:hypothetical protein